MSAVVVGFLHMTGCARSAGNGCWYSPYVSAKVMMQDEALGQEAVAPVFKYHEARVCLRQ